MLNGKILFYIYLLQLQQCFCKYYYNYTMYRGIPINEDHLNFYSNLTDLYNANFWRSPGQLNKPVDFVIPPEHQKAFYKEVIKHGLYLTTVIEDVQQVFNMQSIKNYLRRRTETFDWMHYYRLNDIYTWMIDLAALYPKKMKTRVIGKTHENRDILAAMINHREVDRRDYRTLPLKKVIIEGGIHAREWISPAFVTFLMNEVLHASFTEDDAFQKIAYTYEWHFVPILNPDGYEYTHTGDRMWRKNRNGDGIDINRNFGYAFGTKGVSFNSTKEIYCGPEEFSEAESQAMSAFVKVNSKNLEYYLAFHSYGQFIIIPYADSKQHLENFDEVYFLAKLGAKHLQKLYGTKYTYGTAYDTVGYLTSGISGDWVKKTYNVPIVSTFELRDAGRYGFALPPHLILPTCKETLEAIKVMLSSRPTGGDWKSDSKGLMQMSSYGHVQSKSEAIGSGARETVLQLAQASDSFQPHVKNNDKRNVLRDAGRYDFALPLHLILPTCKETLEAIKVMLSPRTGGDWKSNSKGLMQMSSYGHVQSKSEAIVIVLYVLLFIITRFDYF